MPEHADLTGAALHGPGPHTHAAGPAAWMNGGDWTVPNGIDQTTLPLTAADFWLLNDFTVDEVNDDLLVGQAGCYLIRLRLAFVDQGSATAGWLGLNVAGTIETIALPAATMHPFARFFVVVVAAGALSGGAPLVRAWHGYGGPISINVMDIMVLYLGPAPEGSI